ncbi:MAG: ABC transporter ATP-binding protein [Desulfurococcaceae archaeon]|jgi:ABC-type multidrug transport system ATPase subunit|nr:ABC transporter ATP-binding protein [Desulfurococcaceae archaeon]
MEIELKNIWYSYDSYTYVLKDVNLVLREPGLYVVVGPNGSGKTTLLKILSLIIKPSKGSVLINGRDFWVLGDDEKSLIRKSIVYVHDKPVLLRGSVRYNVELGLRLRGEKRGGEVLEYISRYGLREVLDKPVNKLSAGQAKAMTIVRALILKPKILALDEPFTFLDNTKVKLLIEDIQRIVRDGGIVVIATHYMYRDLEDISKNVIEVVNGEVATLSSVKKNPTL